MWPVLSVCITPCVLYVCVLVCPDCLFVWSDQCVIVCPLSLTLLLPVTPEAVSFLSTVGLVIVLLTIFLLFINKKLCFSRVGGLPCLEQNGHRKKRPGMRQSLGEWPTDGGTAELLNGRWKSSKDGFSPKFYRVSFLPLINKNVSGGFPRRRGGDVCVMLNGPERCWFQQC